MVLMTLLFNLQKKRGNQFLRTLWNGVDEPAVKDAGTIFADPVVVKTAEEFFVPCAFNTWDRSNAKYNEPMKKWGAGLAHS
eukprot:CAMPEP_0195255066 /NCGR_PEP_ID=MMETSP0706-20130129/5422_1 /TAXON_ID=33640 /ORGANISM="Asterionellopsis glacialis, Strain CCMP134" /LENGTH=80 /DNA_ID=CAMNT_0040307853 /DNA_START=114 /DNA_END=355 /DNA_ORIENTATION=-